jgi:hypothetical protein
MLFSGWTRAQGADTANAEALVRAMRSDVILLEASKAALSRATTEGRFSAAQYRCFEQLPASAFTADLADILSKELTAGEISEALEFYTSPAGTGYVDVVFALLKQNANTNGVAFGGQPTVEKPSLTADQMKAVMEFSKTPAGTKLERDKVLMKSPETDSAAKRIVGQKLEACGAKVPPRP